MDLPQTTEYALRALAHIATLPDGTLARAETVSNETGVPLHYLHKILRRLAGAGILEAKKGPGGGFALAKAPHRIRFMEILEAMDSPMPDACAFGWGKCDANHPCPLHGTYSEFKNAMIGWASKTTLADVRAYAASIGAERNSEIRRLPMASRPGARPGKAVDAPAKKRKAK
ncbi:MAG: Rrf2 family transcriptional regulator [Deltaproteobacteria bacterium]|nr:Rrf2 family transcriptional regulator [Deltaproteobacteria bacterium]